MTRNNVVEECLETVHISISIDDKNLQSTVCNILNKIDVFFDRTIVKFSSRRKSAEVLRKKKKNNILMAVNSALML